MIYYIAPKALKQCTHCNYFWPCCQPYYAAGRDVCSACQPKEMVAVRPVPADTIERGVDNGLSIMALDPDQQALIAALHAQQKARDAFEQAAARVKIAQARHDRKKSA